MQTFLDPKSTTSRASPVSNNCNIQDRHLVTCLVSKPASSEFGQGRLRPSGFWRIRCGLCALAASRALAVVHGGLLAWHPPHLVQTQIRKKTQASFRSFSAVSAKSCIQTVGSLRAMKAPAAFFASAEMPGGLRSRCADERASASLPTFAPAGHVQLLRILSRS